jgi:hypothetical protein
MERGPTDYLVEALLAYIRENKILRDVLFLTYSETATLMSENTRKTVQEILGTQITTSE